ncbi:MAG: GNAT family N-acetyltransferase [Clostridia bacterium]|nr:GNAT family N-acetyltransferase [Clostridia bacterium]
MIPETTAAPEIRALFDGWQDTMIWSCLDGSMGHLYTASESAPVSAAAMLGSFCFLAGTPDPALLAHGNRDYIIMTARTPDWFDAIETHFGSRAHRITRFAFKKEPDVFCPEHLRTLAVPPDGGYRLRMIDAELYHVCLREGWSRDFVALFDDCAHYLRAGIGVVAVHEPTGEIVAGASSYSRYRDGIEIEIDTRQDHRRRGLATACGARLILECLERGLYPSWDAHTEISAALAQKLGYRMDGPYTAYEIYGD